VAQVAKRKEPSVGAVQRYQTSRLLLTQPAVKALLVALTLEKAKLPVPAMTKAPAHWSLAGGGRMTVTVVEVVPVRAWASARPR